MVEKMTPEDQAEQFIQSAIDRAPEPLRRLGEWLADMLDDDQWPTADRLLLGAADALRAEVEKLTREIATLQACSYEPIVKDLHENLKAAHSIIDALTSRAEAAEASAARMREALEPFASAGDYLASATIGFVDDDMLNLAYANDGEMSDIGCILSFGHFRAARAAIGGRDGD